MAFAERACCPRGLRPGVGAAAESGNRYIRLSKLTYWYSVARRPRPGACGQQQRRAYRPQFRERGSMADYGKVGPHEGRQSADCAMRALQPSLMAIRA